MAIKFKSMGRKEKQFFELVKEQLIVSSNE